MRNRVLDARDETGRLEIYMPKPTIVLTIGHGHLSTGLVRQ